MSIEPRKKAPPHMASTTGGLISDEDATRLSGRLALMGDQWQEIFAELQTAGYGEPAAVGMGGIAALAATEEERLRLYSYWREWAKERLAGLVGPISILRGKYPKVSAYRSDLIAALREDVASGRLKSEGPIVSRQMEPTLKRYIEMFPNTPVAQKIREDIQKARQKSVLLLGLEDNLKFLELGEGDKYKLLIQRYCSILERQGFKLDSHRKTGLVFRKRTSNMRWDFLFIDQSRGGMDIGVLSPSFALTLPKKAVLPEVASLSSVATFSPEDLVPRFDASACSFKRNSYAEFSLSADSVACLTGIIYKRLDALLSVE